MPADQPSAVDALTHELGARPPDSIAALPDDVLRRLATQIGTGHRQHDRAGLAAIEAVLENVPLPIRGILKKALR